MEKITVTHEVYDFEELTKEVQAKVIQKEQENEYRLGYPWYEHIMEDFQEKLEKQGWELEIKDIFFSLSYCQGDGASFDAKLDVLKYMKVNKLMTKFPTVTKWAKKDQILGSTHTTSMSSHYCHENTRYFEIEHDMYYDTLTEKEQKKLDWETEDLEKIIEEDRDRDCRELHKLLQEDYEYLSSDEVIKEGLIADEYKYLITGERYD